MILYYNRKKSKDDNSQKVKVFTIWYNRWKDKEERNNLFINPNYNECPSEFIGNGVIPKLGDKYSLIYLRKLMVKKL